LEQRTLLSGSISSGQTITATLTRAGELDTYTFSAAAGSSFEISLGDATAASTYQPYLQVAAPSSTRIINDTSAGGGVQTAVSDSYTVPSGAGGPYTITVQDYSSSAVGAYSLELIETPGKVAGATAISSGQTDSGTIKRYGDLEAFTFSASAGSAFELSLGDSTSTSNYQPYLQLLSPSGTRVINDTRDGGGNQTAVSEYYAVPSNGGGTYTVIVENYSTNVTGGAFSLEFIAVPGTVSGATAIADGQTDSGTIKRYGDLEDFTFPAAAGSAFEISLGDSTSSSNYQPYLQVLGPDGTRVINDTSAGGGDQTSVTDSYTVPSAGAGNYTIIVENFSTSVTGGAFSLEAVEIPGTITTATPITSGQTDTATIKRYGDLEFYTFSASAGDSFEASLGDTTPTSTYQPYLQLFGPTGIRLVNNTSAGGGHDTSISVSYTVPSAGAGNYTLIVENFSGSVIAGAYTLELTGKIHPTNPSITLTAPAAQTAFAGVSKSFSLGSYAASNTTAPYTVVVNWGDGSAQTKFTMTSPGTIPAQAHSYAKTGTDSVSVTVTDAKSHTSNKGTFAVTVTAPANASISGEVFNDGNGDGKLDAGELGLGLWQVYIDTNKDGKYDTGDILATTNAQGAFSFKNLAPGTYQVRVVQQTGTATTTTGGALETITVAVGQSVTGVLFGEKAIG
jgi:uncharacterized protein (DUF2141 family)